MAVGNIALDFETADYQPDSACHGVGEVRGGRSYHHAVQPYPSPERRILFTWVHGITMEGYVGRPTFLEFWPQMASFLQGVTHVAHNAPL